VPEKNSPLSGVQLSAPPADGQVPEAPRMIELRAEKLKKRYRSRVVVKDVSLEVTAAR
jgi:hypothetical protein